MTIRIRTATENDASMIASISIAVWIDTYAEKGMNTAYASYVLSRFSESNTLKLMQEKAIYIAETAFGICGFAIIGKKIQSKYEIETMYLLNQFHRQGIGKKLLDRIFKDIDGPFWLKCADYNPKALAFYRQNGFTDAGMTDFVLDHVNYPCVLLHHP